MNWVLIPEMGIKEPLLTIDNLLELIDYLLGEKY
jgi:hypothetical protein